MKKQIFTIISVLFMGVATIIAQKTPSINLRQENQKNRINQGFVSGELTKKEAANLKEDKIRIKRMESNAKADGIVSGKERARIHNAQDNASKEIARKKHNDRTRY